jgi:hypothetical protein
MQHTVSLGYNNIINNIRVKIEESSISIHDALVWQQGHAKLQNNLYSLLNPLKSKAHLNSI